VQEYQAAAWSLVQNARTSLDVQLKKWDSSAVRPTKNSLQKVPKTVYSRNGPVDGWTVNNRPADCDPGNVK